MEKLAILGGRVIDPANQFDETANIYIADGKIAKLTPELVTDFTADTTLNVEGFIICPGLVDVQASLLPLKKPEELPAKLQQALKVGVTDVATWAFSSAHCLSPTEIAYLNELAGRENQARTYFIGGLTQHLEGQRLNELLLLKEAGCIGFSNGFEAIKNALVRRRCYEYAGMLDLKVYTVLENADLSAKGCMHEGKISASLGLPGIPTLAETLALSEEMLMLADTQVRAHFYFVSAKESVALIESARSRELSFTAGTCIHQFFLTESEVQSYNGFYRVRPPFRERFDLLALRKAVKSGILDAICSGHIALPKQMKELPFQDAMAGLASWPLLLPLSLQLAKEENMSLLQIFEAITTKPANILGIDAGHLSVGKKANLLIVDANEKWSLSDELLSEFGSNNPFSERQLTGRVKHTIVNGQLAFSDSA